jgi:alkylated DNA repair dioxygenase AlkB
MNTLFPVGPELPEGFLYIPDFLTKAAENELFEHITRIERHTFTFQGYEAKRKVASFGYDWSFEKQALSKGKDIPPVFYSLIEKVAKQVNINVGQIAELLITEYPAGSVINWHRDAPPFDLVAGISLISDCTFRFRPYEKSMQDRSVLISLPVRRRSLYVMQGPSRSQWQHSIAPVKTERYSITLRTLREEIANLKK